MTENDRLPWFQCYPSKLLGALAAMSADEKLVYVILILRIYEKRGPCPDAIEAIARRVGINKKRTQAALDTLFADGKLKRVEAGIMNPFAETMLTANEATREERQRAGSNGGKRAAENRKQKQQDPHSKAIAKPSDLDSDKEGEKEVRKTQTAPAREGQLALTDWPTDYREQFWTLYPRRLEKKAALSKLEAIMRGGRVTWLAFKTGLDRYVEYCRGIEPRFIKHPTTWLNRGCWDDELPSGGSAPAGEPNNQPRGGGNPWAQMVVEEYEGVAR